MKRPRPGSPLQSELKQTRPFRSPGHEALVDLARTADELRRRYADFLAPHRITPQQYNVLRILRGAGPPGLPTLEIAERMVERAPGITRLIDRLLKQGWVRREKQREDRREVRCLLTESGAELLARLDGLVDDFERVTIRSLSSTEQRQLIELLDRLRGVTSSG